MTTKSCPECKGEFEFTFWTYLFRNRKRCPHCKTLLGRFWDHRDERRQIIYIGFFLALAQTYFLFGTYYWPIWKKGWVEEPWAFRLNFTLAAVFVLVGFILVYRDARRYAYYIRYEEVKKRRWKRFPINIFILTCSGLLAIPLAVVTGPNKNLALNFLSACPTESDSHEKKTRTLCNAGARLLLFLGADPNNRDFMAKFSPLGLALGADNPEMVDMLLNHGADVTQIFGWDALQYNPMDFAVRDSRYFERFVKLAGGYHVKVAPKNENLLSLAIFSYWQKPNRVIILKLMDQGLDINKSSGDRNFIPFLYACFRYEADFIEEMIARGADVNLEEDQYTPAHFAASNKDPGVMLALIRHGADVQGRDKCGHTPLDDAREKGNEQVIQILEDHLGIEARGAKAPDANKKSKSKC